MSGCYVLMSQLVRILEWLSAKVTPLFKVGQRLRFFGSDYLRLGWINSAPTFNLLGEKRSTAQQTHESTSTS